MLAVDVQEITRAALAPLYPVLTPPRTDYGLGGGQDFAWHVTNRPRGWVVVKLPYSTGLKALWGRWSVTVEAAAATEAAAQEVARQVVGRLHGTPRNPTPFAFQGESWAGRSGDGFKYILSFVATLRH